MLEDPAGDADTTGLGGRHELLLTQGQDLATDQTGNTGPAQEAQDQHQVYHSQPAIHTLSVHGGTQNDDDGHGGDAVEDIHHTHDEVIHPAAEITGNAAEDDADDGLNDDDDEADHQGHTAAVHQAGQHIHAVAVGTHQVLLAGSGILIVLAAGLLLQNGPAVGGSVEGDIILRRSALGRVIRHLTVVGGDGAVGTVLLIGGGLFIHDEGLVGVGELFAAGVDGVDELA